MRGSPILRSILVALALVVGGVFLQLLGQPSAPDGFTPPSAEEETSTLQAPFVLTLSHPAIVAILESGGVRSDLKIVDGQVASGILTLEEKHTSIFIDVSWRDPEPAPRFAKLTLEPPGRPTLTRTFDSHGELSDVWEIRLEP